MRVLRIEPGSSRIRPSAFSHRATVSPAPACLFFDTRSLTGPEITYWASVGSQRSHGYIGVQPPGAGIIIGSYVGSKESNFCPHARMTKNFYQLCHFPGPLPLAIF